MTIPPRVEDAIYAHARRDLAPAPGVVHTRIAASVGLGGLVSLFLCGQFGIGLSPAAEAAHGLIMAHTGMIGCAAICGVLFAVVPVLSLRVVCRPLLFRVLVTRHFGAYIGWTAAFGLALATASGRSGSFWPELATWTFAAVVALFSYSRAVDVLSSRGLTGSLK